MRRNATAAAAKANPSLRIDEFGDASVQKAVEKSLQDGLGKATKLSLPITLAILVLAFGALAAAGVPVLLAITAVVATMGLISIPSHIAPVDSAVSFNTPTKNNRLDYLFYKNATATLLSTDSAHIPTLQSSLSDHRMMTAIFTVQP